MKNRDVYAKDPTKYRLLNNGVASVTDVASEEERRTLRYELETFVCDGEYAKGLELILRNYLDNLYQTEQPGVWVSGFFGSGKSHLVKMLRALWVDYTFPEDQATARGLVKLPAGINDLLHELDVAAKREGGLHAASGTLGAGAEDNVRMALLAIVFRSAGLSDQYPSARFELWLREQGFFDAVKNAVEAEGKDWQSELKRLYVSPLVAKALLAVYPDLAANTMEVRKLLKEQYPNVRDVTNQEMVEAIHDAITHGGKLHGGKLPLTLIALDEAQQYIGQNPDRTYAVQEVAETCCKRFGGKLMFVATGQTALAGTPLLQKLMGRFQVPVELSDTDVDAVIRKVVLAKKPGALETVQKTLTVNLGEISRHLAGTRVEHGTDDEAWLAPDYPILPVRRRFWERVRRALDPTGTASLLRNQLMDVFDAVGATADAELGTVVAGDFVFDKLASQLLRTGALPREIYDRVTELRAGSEDDQLKARLCALVFLVGKLPREPVADTGIRAAPDTLADLLVEDLEAGSAPLRKKVPELLQELEASGVVMRVEAEYRLQTRESSLWNDERRNQLDRFLGNPQRFVHERIDLFRKECGERLKGLRLTQGRCKEARDVRVHFGAEEPAELGKALVVWFRDGWEENEKAVAADARAAGTSSPTIYVFLPRRAADELKRTLAELRAATATLQIRGVPSTAEGEEAQVATQTREGDAGRRLRALLDEVFSGARVYQGGGREIAGSLFEAVRQAAENALVRLYPKFDDADHVAWAKVMERARKGSEAALEALDWQGDAEKHPVTAALIKYVAVGKKGSEVRKRFQDPEFGWPRDAIDGAVYSLLATGHLRAADAAGKTLDAKTLDRVKIPQTHFRIEATTVSVVQRIDIRKLFQDVGVPCNSGKELDAMPDFFARLRELADGASGDAPKPERSSLTDVDELAHLTGNEQLVAVHAQRETLAEMAALWQKTGAAVEDRMPAWQRVEELLEQAAPLAEAAAVQEQADAVLDKRLLLSDPDPVAPLLDDLTQLLREALIAARNAYEQEHDAGMERLRQDGSWRQLTQEQEEELLREQLLTTVPGVGTGTAEEVLASLRTMPLTTWADRTAALPTRFERVLLEAAELLEPDARHVRLPGRTLHGEDEIRAWLKELEALLLEELEAAEGGPLVIF